MKLRKECANCSKPFETSLIVREIIIECPSSIQDKLDWKIVNVDKVISSVFKLNYIDHLIDFECQTSGSTKEEEELAVCDKCAKFLTNLYKAHEDLLGRMSPDSYLAQRIYKLDSVLDDLQVSWSQVNQSHNSDLVISHVTGAPHDDLHQNDPPIVATSISTPPNLQVRKSDEGSRKSGRIFESQSIRKSFKEFGDDQSDPEDPEEEVGMMEIQQMEGDYENPITIEDDPGPDNSTSWTSSDPNESGDPLSVSGEGSDSLKVENDGGKPKCHKCTLCAKSFLTSTDLVEHLYNDHLTHKSTCPICKKELSYYGYMKTHLNCHVGHKPFRCFMDGCDVIYSARSNLLRHVQQVHDIPELPKTIYSKSYTAKKMKPKIKTPEVNLMKDCPLCPKVCVSSSQLTSHVFIVHTKQREPFECPFPSCDRVVSKKGPLVRHISGHFKKTGHETKKRRLTSPNSTQQEKFVCKICSSFYKNILALKAHMRIHTDEEKQQENGQAKGTDMEEKVEEK